MTALVPIKQNNLLYKDSWLSMDEANNLVIGYFEKKFKKPSYYKNWKEILDFFNSDNNLKEYYTASMAKEHFVKYSQQLPKHLFPTVTSEEYKNFVFEVINLIYNLGYKIVFFK